ncbi:hypothetical protein HDU97_001504 [Phlyctochytrium planicorne]|nr:hypothetical protein HDU97_001504 [Phlyctochytrium planicorne]
MIFTSSRSLLAALAMVASIMPLASVATPVLPANLAKNLAEIAKDPASNSNLASGAAAVSTEQQHANYNLHLAFPEDVERTAQDLKNKGSIDKSDLDVILDFVRASKEHIKNKKPQQEPSTNSTPTQTKQEIPELKEHEIKQLHEHIEKQILTYYAPPPPNGKPVEISYDSPEQAYQKYVEKMNKEGKKVEYSYSYEQPVVPIYHSPVETGYGHPSSSSSSTATVKSTLAVTTSTASPSTEYAHPSSSTSSSSSSTTTTAKATNTTSTTSTKGEEYPTYPHYPHPEPKPTTTSTTTTTEKYTHPDHTTTTTSKITTTSTAKDGGYPHPTTSTSITTTTSTTSSKEGDSYPHPPTPTQTAQPPISTPTIRVPDVSQCPPLRPRTSPPKDVRDLRIDDIKTVLGIGDSIMAGFGSRITDARMLFYTNPLLEYRGANFATGGDKDSKSVGNLVKQFSPNLKGLSYGNRLFDFCYGPICPARTFLLKDNVPVQGLNAAESGAWVSNYGKQIGYFKDHLLTVDPVAKSDPRDYKLLLLVLGYNDLCLGCNDWAANLVFEADKYEANLREALFAIRNTMTNVVVDVISPFNMSQIHPLTETSKHCSLFRKLLFVECLCLNGEKTRKKMDEMAGHYFERTRKVADELNALNDPGFAVSFDPGMRGLNLLEGKVGDLLSQEDCFHPSKLAHDLIGLSMWNNLFFPRKDRKDYDISATTYYCPTDDSRIRID